MNYFGYRNDTNIYCGRVGIAVMIFVACGIMALTQLFMTIWFLAYHDWWWFISLACVILGNGLLLLSIKYRNPDFIRIVLVYQALYITLCLATVIYMVLLLCHPYKDTPFFRKCMDIRNHGKDKDKRPWKYSKEDCIKKTRVLGGVTAGVFTLLALINLFCLTVIYNFFKYMVETGPIRSKPSTATPQTSGPPAPATASSGNSTGPEGNLQNVENPASPAQKAALRPISIVSTENRPVFQISPTLEQNSGNNTVIPAQNPITPDWDSAPNYNPYFEQNTVDGAPPPVPSHYGRNYSSQY